MTDSAKAELFRNKIEGYIDFRLKKQEVYISGLKAQSDFLAFSITTLVILWPITCVIALIIFFYHRSMLLGYLSDIIDKKSDKSLKDVKKETRWSFRFFILFAGIIPLLFFILFFIMNTAKYVDPKVPI